MLTAIATSKSTVLGLRLDHDRRAWVEAAAAQTGLTVRGFFEGLIDRARLEASGGTAEPDEGSPGAGPSPGVDVTALGAPGRDEGTPAPGANEVTRPAPHDAVRADPQHTPRPVAFEERPPPGPTADIPRPGAEIPRLLLLPGQVINAASSATAALIESGGRCLRDTWRVFLVTLLQGEDEDPPSSPPSPPARTTRP